MAWHPTDDTRVIAPKLPTKKEASFPEKESLFIRTILESVPPEAAELLTLDRLKDVKESSQPGRLAIAGVETWSESSLNDLDRQCHDAASDQKPLLTEG
jgi:hypothetical protein